MTPLAMDTHPHATETVPYLPKLERRLVVLHIGVLMEVKAGGGPEHILGIPTKCSLDGVGDAWTEHAIHRNLASAERLPPGAPRSSPPPTAPFPCGPISARIWRWGARPAPPPPPVCLFASAAYAQQHPSGQMGSIFAIFCRKVRQGKWCVCGGGGGGWGAPTRQRLGSGSSRPRAPSARGTLWTFIPHQPPRRNSGLCHVCTGGSQHKAQKENWLVSGL